MDTLTLATGYCTGCGIERGLTADGLVRQHPTPRHLRTDPERSEPCDGERRPPAAGPIEGLTPQVSAAELDAARAAHRDASPAPVAVERPKKRPAPVRQPAGRSRVVDLDDDHDAPPAPAARRHPARPAPPVVSGPPARLRPDPVPPTAEVIEQIIARATGKGVCRVCGRTVRLRRDGRVDSHRDGMAMWCDGRARMPLKSEVQPS